MRAPIAQDSLSLRGRRALDEPRVSADALGQQMAQGAAQFARGLSGFAGDLAEWDNDLDEADASALAVAFQQRMTRELYDPEAGYLTTARGGAAAERLPETMRSLAGAAEELATAARSERAGAAFRELSARQIAAVERQANSHAADEAARARNAAVESRLAAALDAALAARSDLDAVRDQLATVQAIAVSEADRAGLDDETGSARARALRGDVAARVILARAEDDPDGALRLRDALADDMPESVRVETDARLSEATMRQRARNMADTIGAGGGSIAQRLAQVAEIESAALRDATLAYVRQDYALDEERYAQPIGRAYLNLAEGRPAWSGVAPDDVAFIRQRFPDEAARIAESGTRRMSRAAPRAPAHGPVITALEVAAHTDPDALATLMLSPDASARTAAARRVFPGIEADEAREIGLEPEMLLEYMTPAESHNIAVRAAQLFAQERERSDAPLDPVAEALRAAAPLIDHQLQSLGMSGTGQEARNVRARVERSVMLLLQEEVSGQDGMLRPARVAEIVEEAVAPYSRTMERRLFGNPNWVVGRREDQTPLYQLYVLFADIPARERAAIEAQLQEEGAPATPAAVERRYNQQQLGRGGR